MINKFSSNDL